MTVKELQHLAAAMAHEVRNPLNSMAIHIELVEGRLRKEGASTDEDTERAEVPITDAAEPIGAAEVGKVFHIGSARSAGTVGLTVAKQIVKGHGGSITVKPQSSGNLFTIRLPLELDL